MPFVFMPYDQCTVPLVLLFFLTPVAISVASEQFVAVFVN